MLTTQKQVSDLARSIRASQADQALWNGLEIFISSLMEHGNEIVISPGKRQVRIGNSFRSVAKIWGDTFTG